MLVLSRKTNQKVIISDNVVMHVVAVNGDRVTLGFSAPRNVPIQREEVYRRMQVDDSQPDGKT